MPSDSAYAALRRPVLVLSSVLVLQAPDVLVRRARRRGRCPALLPCLCCTDGGGSADTGAASMHGAGRIIDSPAYPSTAERSSARPPSSRTVGTAYTRRRAAVRGRRGSTVANVNWCCGAQSGVVATGCHRCGSREGWTDGLMEGTREGGSWSERASERASCAREKGARERGSERVRRDVGLTIDQIRTLNTGRAGKTTGAHYLAYPCGVTALG